MFSVAIAAIAVTMLLALIRALLGPSVYDRVLAVNMFGTKTVLLLAIIAFVAGRPDYLDLALAYALINFIGVLAVLEFFTQRVSDDKQVESGIAEHQITEAQVVKAQVVKQGASGPDKENSKP